MNRKETVRTLMTFPIAQAILLIANHGVGKSEVVKQVANKLGVPCVDFRLSENDAGDLKGMPFHVNGRTVFAPPEFMPITTEDAQKIKEMLNLTEDISLGRYGDKGILFLDEINRASREVQQAAFELVLDRRMNFRSLPDGWRVVAAVNGEDSIYSVNSLDPAFLSRFFVINFEPTREEWFEHARDIGVHQAIIDFHRRHDDLLDPSREYLVECTKDGIKKVHDRRAWVMFSSTLNKMEKDFEAGQLEETPLSKGAASLNYLTRVAYGYVGTVAGNRFKAFIESDYKSLDADTILNHWMKDVAKKVQAIVDAGRIPELGGYNEGLLDFIKNKLKEKLNKTQIAALTSYYKILPNEPCLDFWQTFNQECVEASTAWYESSDDVVNMVLAAAKNPKLLKKAA